MSKNEVKVDILLKIFEIKKLQNSLKTPFSLSLLSLPSQNMKNKLGGNGYCFCMTRKRANKLQGFQSIKLRSRISKKIRISLSEPLIKTSILFCAQPSKTNFKPVFFLVERSRYVIPAQLHHNRKFSFFILPANYSTTHWRIPLLALEGVFFLFG